MDVGYPLLNEVAGHLRHRQTEKILDLCGEDGDSNTTGEAHHNGIRDILDDGAQMEYTKHDEEHTCHQRGDGETLETILLDDTIYYNNERARRTTDLYLTATQHGYQETSDDGGDDTLLRGDTRGDTKGNGQRKGYDADDDTCHQIGHELLTVIMTQRGP